jgi:predicted RNase H-like HicB family nuclease
MQSHFTAVFEKHGKWWVAYVQELRGANTQGKTLDEARENLMEAVQLIVASNRETAERDLAEQDPAPERVVMEPIVVDV